VHGYQEADRRVGSLSCVDGSKLAHALKSLRQQYSPYIENNTSIMFFSM
jgi:hypothetical protein